ncbi:MAG: Fic family protein [Candidatus Methanomethylophilaceae archaeon]|nr:Fic family protein [Candidatus Methanomethylophilaceae archaeon]
MREDNYHPVKSGEVRYSDNGGFSYFWPNDLPFDIELDKRILKKVETAIITLSKLDGKVSQMTEQERDILLVPFILMESTKSSAIEGTGTTIEDIYRSERVEEKDPYKKLDNMEVQNYRSALNYATSVKDGIIDENLLLELHRILLNGVRGEDKSPGKYRDVQVLVGNRGDNLDTATFVPMPPESVNWKMMNLFEYINSPFENTLIAAAMSHYQFETIHPFTDGNGRIGRLLIMLILNRGNILDYPVLYLSGYFNDKRDEYIRSLNRVRECDDFYGWIDLFLDALIDQSNSSIRLINSLYHTRRKLHGMSDDLNTLRLIDALFVNPYVRKIDVATICGVHQSTAGRIVNNLVEKGVLLETTGKNRNQMFVCKEIMDILNSY